MNLLKYSLCFFIVLLVMNCKNKEEELAVEVYETSANGNKLTKIVVLETGDNLSTIKLKPEVKFQTITGFGGSFTESSAYLVK